MVKRNIITALECLGFNTEAAHEVMDVVAVKGSMTTEGFGNGWKMTVAEVGGKDDDYTLTLF